jgi:hypothetical protein
VLGLELGGIPLQATWNHDTANTASDACVVVAWSPETFLVKNDDVSGVCKIRHVPP